MFCKSYFGVIEFLVNIFASCCMSAIHKKKFLILSEGFALNTLLMCNIHVLGTVRLTLVGVYTVHLYTVYDGRFRLVSLKDMIMPVCVSLSMWSAVLGSK